MRILFLTWRDLAHPQAGGSEVLVDRLALGLAERGHEPAVLCGGPVAPRPYPVVDAGGTYSQYLRAPFAYRRHFPDVDLVVDVENGIPFFSPLWRRKPVLCLVHHVHEDQWATRFPAPVARLGRVLEGRAMPAVYGRSLFLAVSESTRRALTGIGVPDERIRVMTEGVDVHPVADADADRSPTPLFVVLGRLVPHKRVDLLLRAWRVVQPIIGGELVVIGDGPERASLETLKGPGVTFAGHVSEDEKWRLLSRAWLLVHGAHHEGWGIAVVEAAACGTPALAFDVPGVRDAVVDGRTGVLVDFEAELAAAWVQLARDEHWRRQLGTAARQRAGALSWDATVTQFLAVAEEAVATGAATAAA
jgi:glycosyltransferase involved in cell wall biosynthesis